MKDYEKIRIVAERLISEYDHNDPDYKAAEPFISEIIDLLMYSYGYNDFCEWLVAQDCDILNNFRFADIRERSEYEDEEEFLKDKEDALFSTDDLIVLQW